MEFYPIHKETEEIFKEIRRRIFRLQNGRGLDCLQRIGADTNGQIGASFVSLKTLSQQYTPNLEIALRLWGTQLREEQIVACFLLPVQMLTKEKVAQLLQTSSRFEIAEYGGTLVVAQREDVKELVEEFLHSDNPFLQTAALTAIAREQICKKNNSVFAHAFLQRFVDKEWAHPYPKRVFERTILNVKN